MDVSTHGRARRIRPVPEFDGSDRAPDYASSLAPRGAPGTVAGWTISRTAPGSITLEVASGLLTAHKALAASRVGTPRP